MTKDETKITGEQVRDEHHRIVNVPRHFAYMFAVIVGALVVMLLLIALLGATGG